MSVTLRACANAGKFIAIVIEMVLAFIGLKYAAAVFAYKPLRLLQTVFVAGFYDLHSVNTARAV